MRYKNETKFSYSKFNYPKLKDLAIDKNLAYYLGLLWADGYVTKNKAIIELDETDFINIKKIIKNIGEFRYTTRQRKNRSKKISVCSLHSIIQCSWLINEFSFDKKSYISPNNLLDYIPDNLKNYFYKGYFDGDGCIYLGNDKRKCYQLCFCGNFNQDWSFIETLFLKLNIKRYTIKKSDIINKKNINNKSSIVRITNKEDIIKLREYFTNFGLERKNIKLYTIKINNYGNKK